MRKMKNLAIKHSEETVDLKRIKKDVVLSVISATKLISATQHYIHIQRLSTLREEKENLFYQYSVVEVEDDLERTLSIK